MKDFVVIVRLNYSNRTSKNLSYRDRFIYFPRFENFLRSVRSIIASVKIRFTAYHKILFLC